LASEIKKVGASKTKKVGIVLMERYLANREIMLSHLAELLQFPPGVETTFFIETVGGTQAKIARAVRRILRVVFPLFERL
jgi:hypothetical protein